MKKYLVTGDWSQSMISIAQEFRQQMTHNVRKRTFGFDCAPSEDSDQPAHSRSLIRTFTGRILD